MPSYLSSGFLLLRFLRLSCAHHTGPFGLKVLVGPDAGDTSRDLVVDIIHASFPDQDSFVRTGMRPAVSGCSPQRHQYIALHFG